MLIGQIERNEHVGRPGLLRGGRIGVEPIDQEREQGILRFPDSAGEGREGVEPVAWLGVGVPCDPEQGGAE